MIITLKSCYFDRNYEQDFYVEMDNEEFMEIVTGSEELITLLRESCQQYTSSY